MSYIFFAPRLNEAVLRNTNTDITDNVFLLIVISENPILFVNMFVVLYDIITLPKRV